MLASPGQYVTPRLESAPPGPGETSNFQISFPVEASNARTRLSAGKYITPFTTIGVASVKPPRPPVAELLRSARYGIRQASFSLLTFPGWICFSDEKRVPAKSWLNIGQSAAGFCDFTGCCAVIAPI